MDNDVSDGALMPVRSLPGSGHGGGQLIDSPGIREFGLWHMSREPVLENFIEIRPLLGHCKFRDCAHQGEPGCALRRALEAGEISRQRMDSCEQILESLGSPR